MILPTGNGGFMVLPDNSGPSGPWTSGDTKIVITTLILSLILILIAILIEKLRGFKLREILTLNEDNFRDWLTSYTIISVITFYSIWGLALLGGIGYFIYGLL
jgi:hypothetical protein